MELVRAAGKGDFGFVAGGQKPMTVLTVDEGGPSEGLLLPGDQIVEVNGLDTTNLGPSTVFDLLRNTGGTLRLTVRQPPQPGSTRSILRSCSDEAKKLKKSSSRVRFSEAVEEVEGDGHCETTAYIKGSSWPEPTVPVLKVYLENHQTRSFQFDDYVTAEDVMQLLLQKLEITAKENFSLVVGELGCTDISQFRALPPDEVIAETLSTETRCSLRILYAPKDPYDLLRNDPVAFDYLYKQCCNDLVDERLVPDPSGRAVALRLASLYMLEHALVHDIQPNKITAKKVDKEFGLRSFLAPGLVSSMQPKVLHRKLDGFLKLNRGLAAPGQKRVTALQARMHYMQIAAGLPAFCARRFATRSFEGQRLTDMVLLVGPNCGISRLVNDSFRKIISLEDVADLKITDQPDEEYQGVLVKLVELRSTHNAEAICLYMKDASACDFCTYVDGYRALLTGKAATSGPYLRQLSKDGFASAAGTSLILPYDDSEEIVVPPADYDEATTDSDGEAAENAHAVNSILSAAFDDLDDGLLGGDAEDGSQLPARLTKGDALAGDSQADQPKKQPTVNIHQTDQPQLVASDASAVAIAGSSAVATNAAMPGAFGAVGKHTLHDEEIGMQMSAIDAAISRDRCGRGEDESGIDSDSEDSGNETLNSVDTTSSYMTGDSQLLQGLSWSLEPGNRSPDRCIPRALSTCAARAYAPGNGKAIQQHDPESKVPSACATTVVQGMATKAEGMMMAVGADADDVSTEDDDDEEDGAGCTERTANAHSISEEAAFAMVLGGERESLAQSRGDSSQLHSAVTRRPHQFRVSDRAAGLDAVAQRPLAQRPFSDGIVLSNSPSVSVLSSSNGRIQEVGKSQSKLVRQDAIVSGAQTAAALPAESPSVTVGSGRSKSLDMRRATVASSSKLAQAFAKLSASSSSGSHDFCPATPPRQRSISAPFNVCSTAQGVLARCQPVRAPLLVGTLQSGAPSEDGLPSTIFRPPRPSHPPPPPPSEMPVGNNMAHQVTGDVEAATGNRLAPDFLGSRNGHAASPTLSATVQKVGVGSSLPTSNAALAKVSAAKSSHNVLAVRQSVDDLQPSPSESQRSPHDTASGSKRHMVRSSSGSLLSAADDAGNVSFSFGGLPDGDENRRAAGSEGSAASSKSRVFARLLDALRPRKKSASLSRAASAIELVPRADSKKLSLPRSISGTSRQRPSIFSRTHEVTLLRATSLADCGDDGAETGSPEEAWPSNFGLLPAAEVCTIDTTTRAPKETWSKTCDLETFRSPSPTIGKEPSAAQGALVGGDIGWGRSVSLQHQQSRLGSDADVTAASSDVEAVDNAASLTSSPEEPHDADGPDFGIGCEMTSESINQWLPAPLEEPPREGAALPAEVCTRALDETAAEQAADALRWTGAPEAVGGVSSERCASEEEADPEQPAIGCGSSATQSLPIRVGSQSFNADSDDEEAPPPASEMSRVVAADAVVATSRGPTLTDLLANIGDPGDAAGACAAVERLLDFLSRFEEAPRTGDAAAGVLPAAAVTAANPEDVAAEVLKRLSSEAQLMVVECKQMVAAIARRQRHEAAASGAGDSDANASGAPAAAALREEERRLVGRSFGTLTRLLGSAASYSSTPRCNGAASADHPARLRGCLLTLGRAYAAALSAASGNAAADAAAPHTSDGGTSLAGDPAERTAAAPAGLSTSGGGSEAPPAVQPSADELVRRLMAIATALATALGGLIRLLKAMRESDASQ